MDTPRNRPIPSSPPSPDTSDNPDLALMQAIQDGDDDGVQQALANGADIHHDGSLPLLWAAEEGRPETLVLLLERGACILSAGGEKVIDAALRCGHAMAAAVLREELNDPGRLARRYREEQARMAEERQAAEAARRDAQERACLFSPALLTHGNRMAEKFCRKNSRKKTPAP